MNNFTKILRGETRGKQHSQFSIAQESFKEVIDNFKRLFSKDTFKKYDVENTTHNVKLLQNWLRDYFLNEAWLAEQQFGSGSPENKSYIGELKRFEKLLKWGSHFKKDIALAMSNNIRVAKQRVDNPEHQVKLLRDTTKIVDRYAGETPIEFQKGVKLVFDKDQRCFSLAGKVLNPPPEALSKEEAKELASSLISILEKYDLMIVPGASWDHESDAVDFLRDEIPPYAESASAEFCLDIEDGFVMFDYGIQYVFHVFNGYIRWLNFSVK